MSTTNWSSKLFWFKSSSDSLRCSRPTHSSKPFVLECLRRRLSSESSELKLLTEKPEKSLRFCFFDSSFLKKVWETQNCEKWSLISETILPLVILASTLLVKILSINVAELLCTRIGLSIVGVNQNLKSKFN